MNPASAIIHTLVPSERSVPPVYPTLSTPASRPVFGQPHAAPFRAQLIRALLRSAYIRSGPRNRPSASTSHQEAVKRAPEDNVAADADNGRTQKRGPMGTSRTQALAGSSSHPSPCS
ncbi:hypothetical protein DICSQDRAFT_138550 [Dichomitus squalens LYAD-421 SS1]|uniref:Uncharacterized protein n=1 Tax=Dichomitus squalens (strain LYAD-421) TaxID=732165 RepID=R7SUI2_DICSQ|nr:uncharacterized protein DICSQDRAFT_138550 [Dichomitus squalens LYAD-421 SS1]EJF59425.1 hypothetical protein DICSQDRAFT_138550 [Dichomitus squalens LYAD-421 SS1]